MELYMAVCNMTSNVKVWSDYDAFREFANEHEYSHSYYKISDAEEIADTELFYY